VFAKDMGVARQGDLISDVMKLSVVGSIINGKAISTSIQPTRVHRLALNFDETENNQYVEQCQELEDIATVNRKEKKAKKSGNSEPQATDTISPEEGTLSIVDVLEIHLLFDMGFHPITSLSSSPGWSHRLGRIAVSQRSSRITLV